MKKISEIRRAQNMTQTELASRVGISRVYLSMIENGKQTNISVTILAKIASALDTSITTLFD